MNKKLIADITEALKMINVDEPITQIQICIGGHFYFYITKEEPMRSSTVFQRNFWKEQLKNGWWFHTF